MNNTILAVDPSIRACGYALLVNQCVFTGLIRSKHRNATMAAWEVGNQLIRVYPLPLGHLIIERPMIVNDWTKGKSAIEKLLLCAGACLMVADNNTKIWAPTVQEWKGQLPKGITHRRAMRYLNETGIEYDQSSGIPKSLEHNVLDAVALLTTYLKKEGIK